MIPFQRIVLVIFLGFVGLIGTMVYKAISQKDIALVSEKYYEEEIAYQHTIDALSRTPQKAVNLIPTDQGLSIQFDPERMAAIWQNDPIRVHFLRMENKALDQDTVLADISTKTLRLKEKGRYQVKISWTHNNLAYLWKSAVYL